jgi:hypothetical protein
MSRDADGLILGGAGVDTIVHVPKLPLPHADSHPGSTRRRARKADSAALYDSDGRPHQNDTGAIKALTVIRAATPLACL